MVEITKLTPDDVEAGLELSTQAGWNQVTADWQRFITLSPEGCFAGRINGRVVATTCVSTYDDVAWIGMVLVDEEHRGNGYGTALFEHALGYAEEKNLEIGLDATEYGASIYRKNGFRDSSHIERWRGTLDRDAGEDAAAVVPPSEAEAIYELDRRAVGVDRTRLLEQLLSEVGTSALGVRDENGELTGYAILRPGRECPQLGPIVVLDPSDLTHLLDGTTNILSNPEIIIDTIPDAETTAILDAYGLSKRRELVRMCHDSDRRLLNGPAVRGVVDFAWG